MADLVQVADADFAATVEGSSKPFVLDFWAPWCGPCRMMEPVLKEVAAEYDSITVGKLNVDENPGTATRFDILSIPTLLVFKDGQVVKKIVGARSKKQLVDELARHVVPHAPPLSTVFFGGGTPTLLPAEDQVLVVKRLLEEQKG